MTNAGSLSWFYRYHQDNDDQNRTSLQALTLSHETSPWMGDRQTFQVMPSAAEGIPDPGRNARELTFEHENETARPHYYKVGFDNGQSAEIAPTDHAAVFRFTYPGDSARLVFDNVNNDGGLTLDPAAGTLTGFTDTRSGLSNGATRMYVYATFDQPVTGGGKYATGERPNVQGHLEFDAGADRTVTMRIATSLIGIDQARRNLELEQGGRELSVTSRIWAKQPRPHGTSVWRRSRSTASWSTTRRRTTVASHLYRLNLYPNSGHENVGTADEPRWVHASPLLPAEEHTDTRTGSVVVDGKFYRQQRVLGHLPHRVAAVLVALAATGRRAGRRLPAAVPGRRLDPAVVLAGLRRLMVGTSSDVAFADAYVKDVKGRRRDRLRGRRQERHRPASGLRDQLQRRPQGHADLGVPRLHARGRERGRLLGARGLHQRLRHREHGREARQARRDLPRREEAAEGGVGVLPRPGPQLRQHLRHQGGLLPGPRRRRHLRSRRRTTTRCVWGSDHDYTETNGWNFAFHTPQDGQGLANLYGGRGGLAKKLDTFFSTPETGEYPGSYGGIIHEIREARDVRMGQWGFSNQVSHHIPWMYSYTGQPWKTQEIVRETLRRMYTGSEIGQGYAGDEDNGETSAWYLFASLGLYPLQMGSENLVLGSPQFTKATLHLEGGKDLVIKAPKNSNENIYVQGVKIDGKRWDETYVSHKELADGGAIEFDMGSKPSRWGTSPSAVPPSLTTGSEPAAPIADRSGPGKGTVSASGNDGETLVDNDSGTQTTVAGDGWVEYRVLRNQGAGLLLHPHQRRRRWLAERLGRQGVQRRHRLEGPRPALG